MLCYIMLGYISCKRKPRPGPARTDPCRPARPPAGPRPRGMPLISTNNRLPCLSILTYSYALQTNLYFAIMCLRRLACARSALRAMHMHRWAMHMHTPNSKIPCHFFRLGNTHILEMKTRTMTKHMFSGSADPTTISLFFLLLLSSLLQHILIVNAYSSLPPGARCHVLRARAFRCARVCEPRYLHRLRVIT